MALRQLVPDFTPDFSSLDAGKAIPLSRRAQPLEFRTRGGLQELIEKISAGGVFELSAATGAGKTTRFPHELAEATGTLVLVLFPYEHMAAYQHQYAVERGKDVVYLSEVDTSFPAGGVVFMSVACLVARWMSTAKVVFPKCHVLHDESHESGAYTAVVRALAPTAGGKLSYTLMSATHGVEVPRRAETGGTVVESKYNPEDFEDPWVVFEEGAPWCVEQIDGNVLLFEDDASRAGQLLTAYNEAGANAYRLHSGMSVKAFLDVMKAVRRDTHLVNVLISDSSFRSGYTMPVSTVIDSGKIKSVMAKEGRVVVVSRDIYSAEEVQTKGRGGRMDGQVSHYWRPKGDLQNLVCDVGPADVDAAVVVFRILGYVVPKHLTASGFSAGSLPVDISRALRDKMPLGCIPARMLEEKERSAPTVRKPATQRVVPVPASVAESAATDQSFHDPVVPFPAAQQQRHLSERPGEVEDNLGALMADLSTEAALDDGEYYFAKGLCTEDWISTVFPDGADSVMRVMARDKSGVAFYAWSHYDRAVAVNAMLMYWNTANLEVRALSAALSDARAMSVGREKNLVRKWAKTCAERLAELSYQLKGAKGALEVLSESFCDFGSLAGAFAEEEENFKVNLLAGFMRIPTSSTVPSASQVGAVKDWAGVMSGSMVDAGVKMNRIPMATKGKASYAVPPLLAWAAGGGGSRRRGSSSSASKSSGKIGYGSSSASSAGSVSVREAKTGHYFVR